MWPAVIVQGLRKRLPPGYRAEPRVHSGSGVEIDVAAFEEEGRLHSSIPEERGGVATAVWAPARPSVAVETTLPEYDEYEVRIFDARRGRHLVAAIEIVSPANKDRPEHRNVFVAKCAALLQKGVAVSIVDLVTVRKFNLYTEVLDFFGHTDPTFGEPPPPLTPPRAAGPGRRNERSSKHGRTNSPSVNLCRHLPFWLSNDLAVPLDLEQSYEQACHDLWIA